MAGETRSQGRNLVEIGIIEATGGHGAKSGPHFLLEDDDVTDETAQNVGWPEVKTRLAHFAETAMGQHRLLSIHPIADPSTLQEEQRALKEGIIWLERGLPTALGATSLGDMLERAEKGGVLSADEFLSLWRTVSVYRRLSEVGSPEFPVLSERMGADLVPMGLLAAIDRTLDEDGQIRDSASPQLKEIRHQMQRLTREIDEVFEGILRSSQWAPYLQDSLVTIRFGRRVVPVKNEFRNSVPGIVHDQSGSGQTVFVEPLAIVQRQNRLTTRQQEEAREIERILMELTRTLLPEIFSLRTIHDHLGWVDEHFAKVRYGKTLDGVIPLVGQQILKLVNARHPLLAHAVPLSLELSDDRPAILITGPNTGGKTVALKTTGLVVLMALSGLMVPCDEGTQVPHYQRIMADIGDEQNLEQNLSTFSSHLVRLLPMVQDADHRTLCLIDEIGSGTDPEEGSALAQVIVERLVERQVHVLATTHYNRLKLMALRNPAIQNALVEFDLQTLKPTYRFVMGMPGSSYAFEVARRLGFPVDLVERAEALRAPEAATLSEAILEVNRLETELKGREIALQDREKDLTALKERLAERERVLEERIEKDRQRAANAWRRELEDMTQSFNDAVKWVKAQEGREREQALQALRDQYRGLARIPERYAQRNRAGEPPQKVGDRVRVSGFPDVGIVMELHGKVATVAIGSLKMKLSLEELEYVPGPVETKPVERRRAGNRSLGLEKSRALALEVDVRGMTQEEALEVVDKYLDDAVLAGAPYVRIIHGKGTGVLRRAVGQFLRGDRRVVRWRLGDAGEGGDGVTVAIFDENDV